MCIGKINTQIRLVSVPCDNATAVPPGRFGGDQSPRAGWVIFLCNAEKLTQPHLPSPERAGRPIWSNYSSAAEKRLLAKASPPPGSADLGSGPSWGTRFGAAQRSGCAILRLRPQSGGWRSRGPGRGRASRTEKGVRGVDLYGRIPPRSGRRRRRAQRLFSRRPLRRGPREGKARSSSGVRGREDSRPPRHRGRRRARLWLRRPPGAGLARRPQSAPLKNRITAHH